MFSTRKLLISTRELPCGHLFQVWTETYGDGKLDIYIHAGCDKCERVALDAVKQICPAIKITRAD